MSTADDSTGIALGLITALLSLALYVWTALALSAVFRKSGEEAWKAWVPFLNLAVLLRLGGMSPWFLLLLVVPVLGQLVVWVVLVIACFRVNVAFGHGAGLTVVAALLFPVWASILGFGPARWLGADRAPAHGPRRSGVVDAAPDDSAYARAVTPAYTPLLDAAPRSSGFEDLGLGDSDPGAPPIPPAPTAAPVAAPAVPAPAVPAPVVAPDPAPAAPAPVASAPPPSWAAWAPEVTGEVTGAEAGAPAPISAVPVRPASAEPPLTPPMTLPSVDDAPATTRPPVTRVPAAGREDDEPWAPARSPLPDPDAPAETSAEVSAIAAGPESPRSARAAVSAQHARPALPDDPIDETIITRRRRTAWELLPPGGAPIPLTSETVILGRKPLPDRSRPKAQLVSIPDGTVSKTHALLVLRDEHWYVTDLGSTNGVLFATVMGTEVEAPVGEEMEAGERFYLGDAEIRLRRTDG